MAKLIYAAITSLDGYVADEQGKFDWAEPDEEVHAFVNDLERPIGTHLYGRRLYETMVVWETMSLGPDEAREVRDYAQIWRAADKIVYSSKLAEPASARTRIERTFDVDTVRALKASSERDLTVGGAHLAAHALRAGLVDELHLFLNPVVIGGGNQALPDGVRFDLALLDTRRFNNGVVHVHYRVATDVDAPRRVPRP